jgi:hypothetical protein
MKDDEFQKKLELMLERFEIIDLEVRQCFDKEKFDAKKQEYQCNESYLKDRTMLGDQYKNSDGKIDVRE